MLTYVLASDGSPLMPTYNIRKVRRMLKDGRAAITGHKPGLTIRLTYPLKEQEAPHTQRVEVSEDTGQRHIGVSVKSEKHEYAHEQYDMLKDEKQRHDDRRKYRRQRRSRLRYRAPRSDNRTASKKKGWLAPSLDNVMRRHADIISMYAEVLPVTDVWLEMGSFDTQMMEAAEKGEVLPEGKDYQKGKRYRISTLREAVFYRDGYRCRLCGKEGKILRVHHVGYWKDPPDHTDRMSGLVSICTDCHTAANHKKGGKLWGWEPEIRPLSGAAFMNTVRWALLEEVRKEHPGLKIHMTYGARTKETRRALCISKSHANDAYCIGDFHPTHHAEEKVLSKRRRNSRVLSKFYDAKYVDVRDGKKRSGSELSCGRTNRSEPRRGEKNERIFRGRKISKGRVSVRKQRYEIQPGARLLYKKKVVTAKGICGRGRQVRLAGTDAYIKTSEAKPVRYAGAYV